MSATGRSDVRSENDYYETPTWCVKRLLEAVDIRYGGRFLDAGAGSAAITKACLGPLAGHWVLVDKTLPPPPPRSPHDWDGVRAEADFLTWTPPWRFDACLMNPPYSLALKFAKKALECSEIVCALLRLNWAASAKRRDFIHRTTPSVYVLPNRPSFTGDGRTDACDYAWFVWGHEPRGVFRVLRATPKEVRCG